MTRTYVRLPTQTEKVCSECKVLKAAPEFYMGTAGRLRSRCKACYAQHNAQQREKHMEKRRAYDAERGHGWERSGREKWRLTEEEQFDGHLRRTYSITVEDYKKLFERQGGVCAICRKTCNRSNSKRLCVDHDHVTGAVRGLLCFKCNVGLGRFDDDVLTIDRAISYLRTASSLRARSIFISGPMSGLPGNNYEAFHAEARRFRALGWHVESPAENPAPPQGRWEDYMRLSIRQLVACKEVFMLPGWSASRGARLEHQIATGLEMPVSGAAA